MPVIHQASLDAFQHWFNAFDIQLICSAEKCRDGLDKLIIRNHGMDYNDDDLKWVDDKQIATINSTKLHLIGRDKLESLNFLDEKNIKYPSLIDSTNQYPFILKTQRGMQGRGVELINSEDDFVHSKFYGDKRVFFQEYLKLSEYRFLYFFGESFYLQKEGEHWKKNIDQAQFKEVDPIESFKSLVVPHFLELNSHFFAIDFFMDADDPIVFDINPVVGTQWLVNKLKPSKLLKCQEYLSLH